MYCNFIQSIISEKDEQLQLKNLNIESLNKVIMKKYKSHMENIQLLEKRYEDAIDGEQTKYEKEINRLKESLVDLRDKLVENTIKYTICALIY